MLFLAATVLGLRGHGKFAATIEVSLNVIQTGLGNRERYINRLDLGDNRKFSIVRSHYIAQLLRNKSGASIDG